MIMNNHFSTHGEKRNQSVMIFLTGLGRRRDVLMNETKEFQKIKECEFIK